MKALTAREAQIVTLLSEGLAPKEIARQLGTRHAAVRQQIHRVCMKTGCETVIELCVKYAPNGGTATK